MSTTDRTTPLPGPPDPWAPSGMPPFRSRPPYVMTEMIAAEPALADRLVHRLLADPAVEDLARALAEAARAGHPILTTGCGTSEHAAAAVAALLNEALDPLTGHEVRAVQALESLRRPLRDGVLVGVSHEGGTEATNGAIRAAAGAGARTALISAGGGSPAAELADVVVQTGEQDQSWCHTVGYLSPLLAGVVLAARLRGTKPDAVAIRALLDVSHEPRAASDMAAGLANVDRIIAVGTGIDLVTVRELALKVTEGARLPAAALDVESVLHGHLAAATRWTGLVLVRTDDEPPAEPYLQRIRRVLAAAAALQLPTAAILGESAAGAIPRDETRGGRIVLPHTGRVPGIAGSLLASAMALQLLAERLARARGVDPDTIGREDAAQAAAHA
jgi:glutamine---fructose-6-phosphate transaminase (isomerizing)